jgi:hypothetical protein
VLDSGCLIVFVPAPRYEGDSDPFVLYTSTGGKLRNDPCDSVIDEKDG